MSMIKRKEHKVDFSQYHSHHRKTTTVVFSVLPNFICFEKEYGVKAKPLPKLLLMCMVALL